MSKKHDREERRKNKLRAWEEAGRRTAPKGYDVDMIRDFLDHLLLAVRVQHYENLKLLKALRSTDDIDSAMKVTQEVSEKLVSQFEGFQEKYQAALLPSEFFNRKNATEAEVKGVMTGVLMGRSAKRDEQIGHLEALQDLYKEVLNNKLRAWEEADRRRTAPKGYNIDMIRDFLDHLLSELHYEHQKLLKALSSTDDIDSAMKDTQEVSEKLVSQVQGFQKKYQAALLASDVSDGTNATEAERDEQIGHLEALQDLFKEALHCARLPFGRDRDGNLVLALK